jgi:hypothetical protein
MREILGGTKNLSDFPFWGAVLPADYREQAEFVVRQYVREMRKTDDLRLALLGAQGEVVGYGLTAAVVFAGMKNLGLSAQDLSKVEKGFSRLKYAAPPEESPKGKGPFKPRALGGVVPRRRHVCLRGKARKRAIRRSPFFCSFAKADRPLLAEVLPWWLHVLATSLMFG